MEQLPWLSRRGEEALVPVLVFDTEVSKRAEEYFFCHVMLSGVRLVVDGWPCSGGGVLVVCSAIPCVQLQLP